MDEKDLATLAKYSNTMDAMQYPNKFSGVIYGDFGVGKTIWSALFGRTRFLSSDKGIISLKNHPELASKVRVDVYRGPRHWKVWCQAIAEQQPGYDDLDTVVIDTISHKQDKFVGQLVTGSTYSDGKARNKVTWTNEKAREEAGEDNLALAGPPDYQRAKTFFTPGIYQLIEAPVNVIFLCHVREAGWMEKADKNKTVQDLARRPSVTESLLTVIGREVDFIGYMDATTAGEAVTRSIQFRRTADTLAKSRIKELDAQRAIPASAAAKILNEWRRRTYLPDTI